MGRIENLLLCAAALWFAAGEIVDLPDVPLPVFQNAKIAREEAALQQFVQQLAPPFRQLYRTELHFVRVACQPTKAQFEKVSANGEAALKAITRKFALRMRELQQGKTIAQRDTAKPRALITEVIAKSVRTILSPEQASRYQKELDRRIEARKRAAILSLVGKVDGVLFMTADQRAKLRKILEEKWNSAINQTEFLQSDNDSFPQMPDTEILAILTESQRTVWRGVSQSQVSFDFELDDVSEIGDEVWAEDRAPVSPNRIDAKAADLNQAKPKLAEKK